MKNLLIVLAVLFFNVSFAQVTDNQAETFEDKVTQFDATVKFTSPEVTFLISRNKIYTFEISSDAKLQKGFEYTFFARLQDCGKCTEKKAIVLDFTESVKQTYDNINLLKAKHELR